MKLAKMLSMLLGTFSICGHAKTDNEAELSITTHNLTYTENIYPILKELEPADGKADVTIDTPIPYKPVIGDLAVFFGIDRDGYYEFLNATPEGMDLDSLYNLALTNHKKRLQGIQAAPTAFGGFAVLTDGNTEALTICCPDILAQFGKMTGKDFYIAVPARDIFITNPVDNEEGLQGMLESCAQVFENGDHTLSRHIFRYRISDGSLTDTDILIPECK